MWSAGSGAEMSFLPVVGNRPFWSFLIITIWSNSLQSQELAACVSLPCPVVEWLMIIQSFGSLNLDKSQLLNRPVFHPSEFP